MYTLAHTMCFCAIELDRCARKYYLKCSMYTHISMEFKCDENCVLYFYLNLTKHSQ